MILSISDIRFKHILFIYSFRNVCCPYQILCAVWYITLAHMTQIYDLLDSELKSIRRSIMTIMDSVGCVSFINVSHNIARIAKFRFFAHTV